MNINADTSLFCLIGHPVSKSLSPFIHNSIYEDIHINARYLSFDVCKSGLEDAIRGIKALGIKGFNVTVPHKVDVIKYLDEVDDDAQSIGAVNTVKNQNGRLIGYNTDGKGFLTALKERKIEITDKTILIIGAGGAARALSFIMANSSVGKIIILNRTVEKARNLAIEIKKKIPLMEIIWGDLQHINKDIINTDIVINCTSAGMYPNVNDMPLNPDIFSTNAIICDIVYKPKCTMFLMKARDKGNKIIKGMDMLIYQGILSDEIWLDTKMDIFTMKNDLKKRILKNKIEY